MKIIHLGFPYKHCYFKTCLPTRQNGVENRNKAVIRKTTIQLLNYDFSGNISKKDALTEKKKILGKQLLLLKYLMSFNILGKFLRKLCNLAGNVQN